MDHFVYAFHIFVHKTQNEKNIYLLIFFFIKNPLHYIMAKRKCIN